MTSVTFPSYTPTQILSFQFSEWYSIFSDVSIKSTIIKPLSDDFIEYLEADGVTVPEGASHDEDNTGQQDDSASESSESEDDDQSPQKTFSFPNLDQKIRESIAEYGSVFPKLNFSSPRDAYWILTPSSPLKCTCPADVYILLKSSDFISHDLDRDTVFEGCEGPRPDYNLELVLRKWYAIDRGREMRCFVKDKQFIGISQRDTNYYEHLNESSTRDSVTQALYKFWSEKIRPRWNATNDYVIDVLLTRDLTRAHIIDFNPYAPKTDGILFTYDDLNKIADGRLQQLEDLEKREQRVVYPELRVIDSRMHPLASRNAPAHQHNMIPIEALTLSAGATVEEFAERWKDELQRAE